mgnify:CR=1 FL=1
MNVALPTTLAELLAKAQVLGVDRLDAQLLAAHRLGRDRTWVIAHGELQLAPPQAEAMLELLRRRSKGEPLAYLTGSREFFGLRLDVSSDVLVPRPDTESLVEWALELLSGRFTERAAPRVIDLGTGSGAIALAIKHTCPRAEVHASDLSGAALAVARGNAERLGLTVHFHAGAWWMAVPGRRFDLALANPPYVAAGDPHLLALRHEPKVALTPAGDRGDGLADIERIVGGAAAHLEAGAWLLLEHGADQAEPVRERLLRHGFRSPITRADLAGRDRVTGAVYPG